MPDTNATIDAPETKAADTTAQDEAAKTTEQAAAKPAELSAFIDADGSFKDGWKDVLVPESLREHKIFDTVGNVQTVLERLAGMESMIGRLQGPVKPIIPLKANPTPQEREEYFRALGRPETPDGYGIKPPDDLKEYYDEAAVGEAAKTFHELGLTPAQVEGLMAFDAGRLRSGQAQMQEAAAKAKADTDAALRTSWGAKYEQNLHEADRIIAALVPEKDRPALLAAMGNSREFAEFLVTVAPAFGEGAIPPAEAMAKAQQTAIGEIEALQKTPGFADGTLRRTNRPEHDRIQKRLSELYIKAYPA